MLAVCLNAQSDAFMESFRCARGLYDVVERGGDGRWKSLRSFCVDNFIARNYSCIVKF